MNSKLVYNKTKASTFIEDVTQNGIEFLQNKDLSAKQKKEKQSEFMYGPEGRKKGLKFSWEGKKPWKSKYKPKRKIIRFSFF